MRHTIRIDGAGRIAAAITAGRDACGTALAPFITAGYPNRASFVKLLQQIASEADIIELGVPFSDPVADGVTIQRSSLAALQAGVTFEWILRTLDEANVDVPIVIMSYLNPLMAYGLNQVARDAASVGVCGFIVPDMPFEESDELRSAAHAHGMCVIQMVSPVTRRLRAQSMCAVASGFVYATTLRGVTGSHITVNQSTAKFLDDVRMHSSSPVLAGFGIRSREDVAQLQPHCDGVIVGSALIEAIDRGDCPSAFLRSLRTPRSAHVKGDQP